MIPDTVPLNDFLQYPGITLDVRSPAEFEHGHIPESFSFPLFNNEERAQIGTHYKLHGHQSAVDLGLEIIEPKIDSLLNQASSLITSSVNVLCWRGGMRSGFVARLLHLLNYPAITLQGGYKSYRRWALHRLNTPLSAPQLCVIGGFTGSGKTNVLHALKQLGEQIIDLEGLAKHRGSAFGSIGLGPQSTQEQFENSLAWEIDHLDWSKRVWIEDESRLIGRCYLPPILYEQMHQVPLLFLECDQKHRLQNLMTFYGQGSKEQLLQGVCRISKRLGSQSTKEITQLIENGQIEKAFESLLSYYDKTYHHQIAKRSKVYKIEDEGFTSPYHWACALQHLRSKIQVHR